MIRNEAKTFKTRLGATLPVPPRFADLPYALRIRLASCRFAVPRIETRKTALAALCAEVLELRDSPAAKPLSHRLSDAFVEKQISEGRDAVQAMQTDLQDAERLSREVFACDVAHPVICEFITKREADLFGAALATICTNAVGTATSIRTGGVQLGADASGARWVFPAPLVAAVIALVGVNAIHPFMDGNGRTSRALFNSLLRGGGVLPGTGYIPLKHIYFIAKFGFEIRLREAVLLNNYVPILNFYCDVMDLTRDLFTRAGRLSEPDKARNALSEEMLWATNE
jgi:hypothetical protein